jgi:hypothetical protein
MGVSRCQDGDRGDETHVDYGALAERRPVKGLLNHILKTEDLLDVVHELDKVALSPTLAGIFSVILDEFPRVGIVARKLAAVVEREGGLGHVLCQLLLATAVLVEGLLHDEHGRTRVIEHCGDEGLEAGGLGKGGGAGGVADANGAVEYCLFKNAQSEAMLKDALDNLTGEGGVFGDGIVGGRAIEGNGGPEVEVVEEVEGGDVWHALWRVCE